jgi:hypothetical protein
MHRFPLEKGSQFEKNVISEIMTSAIGGEYDPNRLGWHCGAYDDIRIEG